LLPISFDSSITFCPYLPFTLPASLLLPFMVCPPTTFLLLRGSSSSVSPFPLGATLEVLSLSHLLLLPFQPLFLLFHRLFLMVFVR